MAQRCIEAQLQTEVVTSLFDEQPTRQFLMVTYGASREGFLCLAPHDRGNLTSPAIV
jgi:hypothetical protein